MTIIRSKAFIPLALIVAGLLHFSAVYMPLWFTEFTFYDFTGYHYALSRIIAGDYPWDLSHAPKGIFYTWNPPFSLGFLLPFGFLTPETSQTIYAILFVCVISFYLYSACSIANLSKSSTLVSSCLLLVALPYAAIVAALQTGGVSVFPLLEFTVFTILRGKGRFFLSGLSLSLTLVKPHLVALPILLIAFHSFLRRDPRIICGLAVGLLISTGSVLLFRPSIFEDYLFFHRSTDIGFVTTGSLPHAIRKHLLIPAFMSSFVLLIGALLVLCRWVKRLAKNDRCVYQVVTISIPFSLFFGPFSWGHDFLLTCPTFLMTFRYLLDKAEQRKSEAVAVWAILIFAQVTTLIMITSPGFFGSWDFVWANAAITLATALVAIDMWRRDTKSAPYPLNSSAVTP